MTLIYEDYKIASNLLIMHCCNDIFVTFFTINRERAVYFVLR